MPEQAFRLLRHGAGDRGRTGTVSLPPDFESGTSANSIIPAYLHRPCANRYSVILSQLARFCKKNLRKFAHDGIRDGDCDARRRSSRRKIALSRARSISRSIGATPQPRRPRRNCASSAAFHSRAAESVSCTVCRMCGGVYEIPLSCVCSAADLLRARRIPCGEGVFSKSANRIPLF